MVRSRNYKRKTTYTLKKSRKYTHLNGGGLVTINFGTEKDKENRQYFSITYAPPQKPSTTIYIIFEKKLLGNNKTWFTTILPTGNNFVSTPNNNLIPNMQDLLTKIMNKIPVTPLNNAITEFIAINKSKPIFGMFGDNNNNIISLLNELKKLLVPILDNKKQLECVKEELIAKILKIKNRGIFDTIIPLRDTIWNNALRVDPNHKVLSITQNCDAAIKAIEADKPPKSGDGVAEKEELKKERAAFDAEKIKLAADTSKQTEMKALADSKEKEISVIKSEYLTQISNLTSKHLLEMSALRQAKDACTELLHRSSDSSNSPRQPQSQAFIGHTPQFTRSGQQPWGGALIKP